MDFLIPTSVCCAAFVTNAYGLYIAAQSGAATLNYAIYSNGGPSYHAGYMGIGMAAAATTHVGITGVAGNANETRQGLYVKQDGTFSAARNATIIGADISVDHTAAWNNTGAYNGARIQMVQPATSGIISSLYGLYIWDTFFSNAGGSGTMIQTRYGLYIDAAQRNGASAATIGTSVGLYIGNPGGVAPTVAYGIQIGSVALATTNYAIYTGTGFARSGGTICAAADGGGLASTVGFTNVTAGVSSGNGTVKMSGTTARDSTGWIKIYDGTNARYIPFWTTITG